MGPGRLVIMKFTKRRVMGPGRLVMMFFFVAYKPGHTI